MFVIFINHREEHYRLKYISDYGKLCKKNRRKFGIIKKHINDFFRDRRRCLNECKRNGSTLSLQPFFELENVLKKLI